MKINITKAAIQTSLIGVKTVDLVKMQQAYTDEIGRSVQLTEAGFVGLSGSVRCICCSWLLVVSACSKRFC